MQKLKDKISYLIVFIIIPIIIYMGNKMFNAKSNSRAYYFISLSIIFLIMIPFFISFEKRKPNSREVVIIAVLTSIAIAGRGAFFMLPQFKPVTAIVIIAGVTLGKETGFLVGALTGFGSNFFFGQGPWTPWQMFSFGIIGFLSGLLFSKGLLKKSKKVLCIYGGLVTFILYGLIMDFASVIMATGYITIQGYITSLIAGLTFNLIHGAATVFFLYILSDPMIEKIDRIKIKYGFIDMN